MKGAILRDTDLRYTSAAFRYTMKAYKYNRRHISFFFMASGYHNHSRRVWVPKMPSERFRPEFHQIDEFNFDSAFVNSDNSASHSLGQTNLRKIRPSFGDGPFALFRRIILIAPSRFLRLDLPSISIREHKLTEPASSCPLIPVMQATDLGD